MRVLASAYACEPGKGSEPAVGWNWVRQIARFHQVWVITRLNNRPSIEEALAQEPLPNVHWVYFDLPRWARFWKKGRPGIYLYYYLWQLGAYFLARRLHGRVSFDVVHHLTFVAYWLPSFLALLPTPFIWGPVGGGESTPPGFWSSYSPRGMACEVMRVLARHIGEWDPFVRLTAKRAAWAFSTTKETSSRLQVLGCKRVTVHSQLAFHEDEVLWFRNVPQRRGGPFRVASIGNLVHWKGFELGLQAFAETCRWFPGSEYWIIGDGPERKRLERLANQLGVGGGVKFWGAMSRAQALEMLGKCDVLLHPSLHDSGGWVCLEAMAAARPVICLDCGGPSLLVTEETGIKVPALSPQQAITGLAAAMQELASEPARLGRLGAAARRRVQEHFDWSNKTDFLRGFTTLTEGVPGHLC